MPRTQQVPYRCTLSYCRTWQDIAIFHCNLSFAVKLHRFFKKEDKSKLKSLAHHVCNFGVYPQGPCLPVLQSVPCHPWNRYVLTTYLSVPGTVLGTAEPARNYHSTQRLASYLLSRKRGNKQTDSQRAAWVVVRAFKTKVRCDSWQTPQ